MLEGYIKGENRKENKSNEEEPEGEKRGENNSNENCDNLTLKELNKEIQKLEAEKEELENNQTLTSLEKQEKLSQIQRRLDKLLERKKSNTSENPKKSDNKFPTG